MMNSALKLVIAVALPVVVGGLSGFATAKGVSDWYPTLVKPSFNPPAWVFGPVWTVLYIMMGVAAYLVWLRGFDSEGVRAALAVFVIQLALNGLWSILFFGMQQPGWALAEIVVLWVAIGATVWLFWRVVPAAGVLLLPYWAWVSFATVLNASLWWLNRPGVS
jgi:tryptophan-rich sensory protein